MITSIFMILQSPFIISAILQSNEKVFTSNTTDNDFYAKIKSALDNYLFDDEVLTFKEVEDLGISQIFSPVQDQPIHNQNLPSSSESFEFLNHVNYVDNPVELEKLNNFDLHALNPKDIDDILKHDETTSSISIMKDYDFFNFKERSKNTSEDENQKTKIDGFEKINLKTRHDIVTTKYKCKVKSNIIQFLVKTISEYYLDYYIKRFTVLEDSFSGLNIFDFRHNEKSSVLSSLDCELVKVLNQLYSNFGNWKEFNQETYQAFNIQFSSHRLEDSMLFYETHTVNLSQKFISYSFYFEFMNLYKYIYEMPELLTVSGIYTNNIFCGVPYILHLINLFAEKVGTLKDNKVFILCLIKRAFLYSKKYRKNFILSSKYITKCPKEHSNFELLVWEINPTKRANMKKRMKQVI